MSPIVEKMEGLKAIRNRSNSLRLGRLAFYRHLEKVETMRSFWELKHVELEGGKLQVTCTDFTLLTLVIHTETYSLPENSRARDLRIPGYLVELCHPVVILNWILIQSNLDVHIRHFASLAHLLKCSITADHFPKHAMMFFFL